MTDLRAMLARGEFFSAPGIHDMITASITRELGFPVVYASGFWLTASALGLPDAGLASYTQMLDRVATLKQTVGPDTAVIADAAQAADMDRQTLRDWGHRYNEEGLGAARARQHRGTSAAPGATCSAPSARPEASGPAWCCPRPMPP